MRILLKDLILENIEEGIRDPGILKCIFLAGGPGAGKSKIVSDIFGVPKNSTLSLFGLKVINSDFAFEKLLKQHNIDLSKLSDEEYEKVTGKGDTLRTQAKKIQSKFLNSFINERLGLIIDGTGAEYESTLEKYKNFKQLGYDCYMVFVNTDLEIALKRNASRERKLRKKTVIELWKRSQNNIGKFQMLFGNDFYIVDNTEDLPIDTKIINKFRNLIKKPIKNKIGIQWMSDQI